MIYKSTVAHDIHEARTRYIVPDWQREQVWGVPKKQLLIDTLLRNWKFPKFYFARTENGDGKFEVVDGQQRFTSILEFIDNVFPLSAATIQEFNLPGGYFKDLSPRLARAIRAFALEYDEIFNATPKDKKDYFQRLQQGVPLTSKEKLNAIHSGLRDYAVAMTKHEFFQSRLPFANARFAYLGIAAKTLITAIGGTEIAMRSHDIRAAFLAHTNFTPESPLAKHLDQTLDFLAKAFPSKSKALHSQTFVQSVITLASQLVGGGESDGHELEFGKFVEKFHAEYALSGNRGSPDLDTDYVEFKNAANAKGPGEAGIRQRIFVKKMREWSPELARHFTQPLPSLTTGKISWVQGADEMAASLSGPNVSKRSITNEQIAPEGAEERPLSMSMVSTTSRVGRIHGARERYVIADWQRGEVWGTAKKQLLIDSVLQGWKLPKFYMSRPINGDDLFEVVDGQQRMASIMGFIDNKFPLSLETARKFNLPNRTFFKNLPPHLSGALIDFSLEVDEIYGASQEALKEFFQRLQQGMPLAGRERLNAVHSELRDYCIQLAKHPFFQQSIGLSPKRHGYFDVASKVVAIEMGGLEAILRFDGIKKLFESTPRFSLESLTAQRLNATFDFLAKAFPDKVKTLHNRPIVQSVITLASHVVATGNSAGHEAEFGRFIKSFLSQYIIANRDSISAVDQDYIEFRKTISADVIRNAKIRHEILLKKMRVMAPALASLVMQEGGPSAINLRDTTSASEAIGLPSTTAAGRSFAPTTPHSSSQGPTQGFSAAKISVSALNDLGSPPTRFAAPTARREMGIKPSAASGSRTPSKAPPASPSLQRPEPSAMSRAYEQARAPAVARLDTSQRRPLQTITNQHGAARLDQSDYAKRYLKPLLKALEELNPPITTIPALVKALEDRDLLEAEEKVKGIFSGLTPILIPARVTSGMKFSGAALIVVNISGKKSREVYADAIKGHTVHITQTSALNGGDHKQVTWDDFADVFPSLASHLKSDKGIDSIDGISIFIRRYWSNADQFRSAMNSLISTRQPFDPDTGRLKSLPSTIVLAPNSSESSSHWFPEHALDYLQFNETIQTRHRHFVDLVGKYYVQVGKGLKQDAPKILNQDQSLVSISFEFLQYLRAHLPGKLAIHKQPTVQGYVAALENSIQLTKAGALAPEAAGLLKLLKVSQSEIDRLLAVEPDRLPDIKIHAGGAPAPT